ncbi:MAG TPA: SRPBCC family protein [Solirubrobacteraceae bacterium]|nr:SRPBCC family protein [Solirubrobacteraceae bacterium]
MGKMEGSNTIEINAPVERCYEIAADVDNIDQWQNGVQRVEVLERDGDGRALVAEISNDAKVTTIKTRVRFEYDPPNGLSWRQEKGDLKSLVGSWRFETAGTGTRATYTLHGDPGRMLGMLIRGPVEGKLRDMLVNGRPGELKARAEA